MIDWDLNTKKYTVLLNGNLERRQYFSPDQIVLPAKTVVKLCNLKNSSEFNGKFAKILSCDNIRYTLVVEGQKQIKVKLGNVVI